MITNNPLYVAYIQYICGAGRGRKLGGVKVKIGMKGEKRVNRLIKNIAKSAQIVIAVFVVYYDVSIKKTLHSLILILMIN